MTIEDSSASLCQLGFGSHGVRITLLVAFRNKRWDTKGGKLDKEKEKKKLEGAGKENGITGRQ